MVNIELHGKFYPQFVDKEKFDSETCKVIEQTVQQLIDQPTTDEKPGMLLGKIQSGKTRTFMGIIALACDNGFDVTVVLTKNTKALAKQTFERISKDFIEFIKDDQLQVFDVLNVPMTLTRYELNQKLVFVVKKQVDNLERLQQLVFDAYTTLADKRFLIIDDEADYASVGFRNSKEDGISISKIPTLIDNLRKRLAALAFLQVTATPYSLYLQPDNLILKDKQITFKPIRPAFTELVPVHKKYIGGDYYFVESRDQDSVAFYLHEPVSRDELETLKKEDRRRFRLEDCLFSPKISSIRNAIVNFIVGGTIRRLQNKKANKLKEKYSFIIHTESGKAAHQWQENIVVEIKNSLEKAVADNSDIVIKLIQVAYDNLSQSIKIQNDFLPSFDDVLSAVRTALNDGQLMITKVNSEQQLPELLDDQGQLRLRTPLNIFIGGQILDRGITISNLIGFFYGRRPNKFQQDTVLQHSRMFGFRPLEDLAVTRFYTSPDIYDAMQKIQDIDSTLRESVDRGDQEVIFIQKDSSGRVIPCSPNKILLSTTTTLRPYKRLLPIGFQTDYKTNIEPIIREIDGMINRKIDLSDLDKPFLVSLDFAEQIIQKISKTFIFEDGYEWDTTAFIASMEHLSRNSNNMALQEKVWCLVRKDRNINRIVTKGHSEFSSSPDTASTEGRLAREIAIDIPVLMLIKQNGLESQGWRGAPFYWPVLVAPKNTKTTIFASNVIEE